MICESGLTRALRRAYKSGGYTVNIQEQEIAIYTDSWYIKTRQRLLPRKTLAAVVEHMGMLPEEKTLVFIEKNMEPQILLEQTAEEDAERWQGGMCGGVVTLAPVIAQGLQIFQPPGGGPCWGANLSELEILERDAAQHESAMSMDGNRLMWTREAEMVVLETVRKAAASWAMPWERTLWSVLEGADLHGKKEDSSDER